MNATLIAGRGEPFDNRQPSMAVTKVMYRFGTSPFQYDAAVGGMAGFVYDFAGYYAPGGSVPARGQRLERRESGDDQLFMLLERTFGGDGHVGFHLPDLQGVATIGTGAGPGRTPQDLGSATGSASVTLTTAQMPAHDHGLAGGGATGKTAGGQPFCNMQRSLPLRFLINVAGPDPTPSKDSWSRSGEQRNAVFRGQIAAFASRFVDPPGWTEAAGQLLPIAGNEALFAVLKNTFGGDGQRTFALPDLRGRTIVGASAEHPPGSAFGEEFTTLTASQLPAHSHMLAAGKDVTAVTGGGQPVSNWQPSLALNYLVCINGMFPTQSDDGPSQWARDEPYLGEIVAFAGHVAPAGWSFAHGEVLTIRGHEALYCILGTQYGGDGQNTYALPDLRGRTLVGSGWVDRAECRPGNRFGADTIRPTEANLPMHYHSLPDAATAQARAG